MLLSLGVIASMFVGAIPAGAQQGGRLTGRVVAAETGEPLQGAVARIAGSSLSAITDVAGSFSLANVPAGDQAVEVSYIGRQPATVRAAVTAGGAAEVTVRLSVEPMLLEGLSVVGARAMTQAEALNRQKSATNIINVVASDLMGRFPDASAPDALQRIPGITVARDQGEGRYIQIRGGSAANTQVNVNGVQVPSPEGEDRQVALDAVPVDLLEAIEVSKAVLPNMDAEAIGGSVNLVTRRAPAGRLLSAEASGGYSSIREEPARGAAVTWGTRSTDDRLGFLLSGSYNFRDFGSDDLEPVWDLGDAGLGDDVLEEMEVRHYSLTRRRLGATGTIDYRVSETSSFALSGIFSQMQDHEQRRNLLHIVTDEELEYLHKNRLEELETWSLALDGDHLLGGTTLSHRLSWARSLEHTPFDDEVSFVQEGVTFSPNISNRNRIESNPAPGAISGVYEFNEIEMGNSDTENTDWAGAVDLSRPIRFGAGGNGVLSFGVSMRQKTKKQEVTEGAAELMDGIPAPRLGQQVGMEPGLGIRSPAEYPHPPFRTSATDVHDFMHTFGVVMEHEIDLEADTNDYDLDERVSAGYLMAEIDLTPSLRIVPGVRYERTSFTSAGFEWDADTETLLPTDGSRSYGNLFPTVHVKYSPGEYTNLRAAFTSTIARPGFFQLVPYRLRDDEDLVLGNPELEPTTARNFDLMFEHYSRRIGVLSLGAFHKRLTNPIFIFTEDNDFGGETEQPRNGEEGTITGLEFSVQQRLSFLPAPFDGFSIYANYTWTSSESALPSGRTVSLQGQPDHVGNLALSYERGPFWGQVSTNFHDLYVSEYGEEAFEDVFVDRSLRLDASFNARVMESGSIFLELVNLTDEPYVAYQGDPSRPIQMEYYQRWGRLGWRMAL